LQHGGRGRRSLPAAEASPMSARAQTGRAYGAPRAPRHPARVAPRARSGRRRTRVDWEGLGRRVLVLVLFAVLASYLNPVINLVDDWRDSRTENEHFAALQRENARLQERVQALDDPDAAEREARRLGMVGPGERAYVIRGLSR
jgi:cell division protein FtsB